jgi:hypothetical protein
MLGTQPDQGGVVQAALVEVLGHSPLWSCLILRGYALCRAGRHQPGK